MTRSAPLRLALLLGALLAQDTLPVAAQARSASAQPMPTSLMSGLRYRLAGPSRGGRVTAVAGHRAQPHTFYMGATGGGVWKTTDAGSTWVPISDGYFASGSIGAIAVAESDPNIVYVATGSDGIRSNIIIGKGVYKSTDAGETWTHVGLENTASTGAVLIHPSNPDLAYVAAIGNPHKDNPERGVFRTRDGGRSWEKVLFVSDSTGAVDLEFAPDDPNTIYATTWTVDRKLWTIISGSREGGLYKSTDGGDTWELKTQGLPNDLRGKADLAVSAGDPDRVYVLFEAPDDEGGVYRSDDRGETWTQVSDFQPIRNRPFYYTNLNAHPVNPDILWGMAEGHYQSTDAGKTWTAQRTPHGDNHDLWINPDNPDIMIQSNDGGANVSLDGGRTWSTQNNQPTAELYQVDVDTGFPYRMYAGQQDNTTISVPAFAPFDSPTGAEGHWEIHGGCETGPAVPKPGDPDVVYANCKGRFGVYNRRTGQEQQYYVGFENLYGANPKDLKYRFQRVVPVHVSPHDPNTVYHGSQFVHRTRDGGRTWETISPDLTAFPPQYQVVSGEPITRDVTGEEHYSVLYDIQESPHEPGVIWAGSNDGLVHVTRDNGRNWTDVTPDVPPFGRVQNIEVSPHDPAKAYATVLRQQVDGDFAPYGFRTEDYGESWTRITTGSNGIPADYPVRVIREDPEREGLLYAGTEFGMFVSFDDGARWQPFQLNLPVTPITDIALVRGDLAISTMGRSFWIMDNLQPLREMTPQMASQPAHLFNVADAYRLRLGGGFGGRLPHEPENPPAGAMIDYSLASDAQGEVTIEILDGRGSVIRSFSSEGPGQTTVEVPTMREFQTLTLGTARVPKTAGAHRFVWDLRLPGPWDPNPRRFGASGPLVKPGEYQARLTVGSWSDTKTFQVMADPRVLANGVTMADLNAQVDKAVEARDALTEARLALVRLNRALDNGASGNAKRTLEEIKGMMETAPIRYSRPMLVDQLEYLYGNLLSADQAPGEEYEMRYDELYSLLQEYMQDLERVLRTVTEQD
ncbi:MAG: hypothetical protein R3E98_10820 [Gemmatimonadota bacterium]